MAEQLEQQRQPQQELFSEPEFDGDEAGGGAMQGIVVDPKPHVSTQFYTFNRPSHQLMVQCLLAGRYALPEEIKMATPQLILSSWRSVWKDRHEDTAYLTGWKRIQDKLVAQVDDHAELLYFKSNPQQFVPHIDQWQEIVQGFHADADLKHLGLKDTIERIKQVWTVGAKFYGIPESYVRSCVAACPVCNSDGDLNGLHKRRRFEYTEMMEVLAKDVPLKLQQLAAKYKVILCIRQKYIRYKPFLAEVKDYCCHRAGEPNVKKSAKKKTSNNNGNKFISNRCGCGFRIRAIVPIENYSYKDKTFTYDEKGLAIFKLYAVHSGHDPSPQESTGVINQLIDSTSISDVSGLLVEKEAEEAHSIALSKIRELRQELASMEAKVGRMKFEPLNSLGHELQNASLRLRSILGMEAKEPQYGVWEDGLPPENDDQQQQQPQQQQHQQAVVEQQGFGEGFETAIASQMTQRRRSARSARKLVHRANSNRTSEEAALSSLGPAAAEVVPGGEAGGSMEYHNEADRWYLDQPSEDDFRHGMA